MFNKITHTVEGEVQNPIQPVVAVLLSEKKGKLVNFPIVWTSGDKGNVAIYTGFIYKITQVEGGDRDGGKCKVYFVDSCEESRKYDNGMFRTTLSLDEVIKLIND